MRLRVVLATLLILPVLAAAGELDPYLDLEFELLAWEGNATLRSFLDEDSPLILVLWNSDCPECLDNVSQVEDLDLPRLGARLVGVNSDPTRSTGAGLIGDLGLTYPQLHDPENLLASTLDAGGISFSYAILDGTGRVLALRYDNVPDARVDVRQALDAIRRAAPVLEEIPEARSRQPISTPGKSGEIVAVSRRYPIIQGEGLARLRVHSLSLRGGSGGDCGVAGPFGEALTPGKNLLYRLSYELTARVAPGISAGGKLRISNENPEILEQGPEYLGNEIGSAFIELHRGDWSGRLGYFSTHFTPLTLQRWDFADNPPAAGSGGASGCATCGGPVRGLSLEALDDLGPNITFEGISLHGAPRPWLSMSAFYGLPQRAAEFNGDAPGQFAYRKDLLAVRVRLLPSLFAGGRSVLAAQYLSNHEDGASSIYPPHWASAPEGFIHKSEAWSLSLHSPLPAGLEIGAEAARSFNRVDRIDGEGAGISDRAVLMELGAKRSDRWRGAAAWMRIGGDYASDFQALSYRPNSEGWRLTAEYRRPKGGLSLFLKSLTRLEDEGATMPLHAKTTSVLLSWKPRPGWLLDLAGTLSREELEEDLQCDRVTVTLSGRLELARRTELIVELTHVQADGDMSAPARADIGTLQLTVGF